MKWVIFKWVKLKIDKQMNIFVAIFNLNIEAILTHWTGNSKVICIFTLHAPNTLREECLYLEFFWSVFSRIWTEQMWENTDQKNSECGHFSLSDVI